MKSFGFLLWMAILLVFGGVMLILLATGFFSKAQPVTPGDTVHVAGEYTGDPARPLEPTEFVLTDQRGNSFSASELDGKIWIGSIFFATCPSTCRMQNQRVQQLQQRYGDQGVEFISITCDPDNDTVSALSSYSQLFSADPEKWHFLTGDIEQIRSIGNEMFGITVDTLVHSDRLVLFDRDGKNRGSYRSLDQEQFSDLTKALDELLAEQPAQDESSAEEDDQITPVDEQPASADEAKSEPPGESAS